MVYWTAPLNRFYRVFTPTPLRTEGTPKFYVELDITPGYSDLSLTLRVSFPGGIPLNNSAIAGLKAFSTFSLCLDFGTDFYESDGKPLAFAVALIFYL